MVRYNRYDILKSLSDLTAHITPNRFINTRPNAVGAKMKEFILLRSPQPIVQWGDACQFSTMQIVVFARDVEGTGSGTNAASGLENTFLLEKMQSEVMALFKDNGVLNTDFYSAWKPILLNGGTDGSGFHSLIIQFQIQIKNN